MHNWGKLTTPAAYFGELYLLEFDDSAEKLGFQSIGSGIDAAVDNHGVNGDGVCEASLSIRLILVRARTDTT